MAVIRRIFPFLDWFDEYSGYHFRLDAVAGLTVALIVVPQAVAYAQLAGVPPQYGLYAALLPPFLAAIFGSCRQLSTGPVAIIALMSVTAIEPIAMPGSTAFLAYTLLLAFMVGSFQFLMGLLRLGLIVNFLSHPVVNGFINAAAIIIATAQLGDLFGVTVDKAEHHYQTVMAIANAAVHYTHWPTLLLGLLAFIIMFTLRKLLPRWPYVLIAVVITTLLAWGTGFEKNHTAGIEELKSAEVVDKINLYNNLLSSLTAENADRTSLNDSLIRQIESSGQVSSETVNLRAAMDIASINIERIGARVKGIRADLRGLLFAAISDSSGDIGFIPLPRRHSADRIWRIKVGPGPIDTSAITLIGGGEVVGAVPAGFPGFTVPTFDSRIVVSLLPIALIIALLGFMESISVARAISSHTGHRLDANQELIGQGLANLGGSFFGSFAVSGSFVRSAANLQSGAVSGISNVIASAVVLFVLLFLTPLFAQLPQVILAAIIITTVFSLFNFRGFVHAWRAQWYDGVISIVTFIGTLYFAPHLDRGIILGIGLSLIWYLLRSMKPAVTPLAKHPDATYRSQDRFGLEQCRHISLIRYDGPLFFANVTYLEEMLFDRIRSMPELKHIVIMANGINELDASGEETLSRLVTRVRDAGVELSFTGLNNAVLDTMRRTGLYEKIGKDHLFRTVNLAMGHVWEKAHSESDEKLCPLAMHPFRKFPVADSVKKDPRFSHGPDTE